MDPSVSIHNKVKSVSAIHHLLFDSYTAVSGNTEVVNLHKARVYAIETVLHANLQQNFGSFDELVTVLQDALAQHKQIMQSLEHCPNVKRSTLESLKKRVNAINAMLKGAFNLPDESQTHEDEGLNDNLSPDTPSKLFV